MLVPGACCVGPVSWGLSGSPRWAGSHRLGGFPEPGHTGQQKPQSQGRGPGFLMVPKSIFIVTREDTRGQRPGLVAGGSGCGQRREVSQPGGRVSLEPSPQGSQVEPGRLASIFVPTGPT